MIKFFRKIRLKMINKNKFSRYLLYALGEIILVVIGILIALQINNNNENRKNNLREINFLENLKDDLIADTLLLENTWFTNGYKKIAGLNKAKGYYENKIVPRDTIQFLTGISFGGIFGIGTININDRTFRELVSTGNISLISDEQIRTRISDYYIDQEFMIKYAENLQSGYPNYINSCKVYNPKSPNKISDSEISMMLNMMQKDEFYFLTNRELTFAYTYLARLEKNKKITHALILDIQRYLNQK